MAPGKHIGKRVLSWLLWILGSLVVLLIILWLLLQTHWGQGIVKRQAERWLENKLQTQITIGNLQTDWFHEFTLKNVYVEDQQGRTLLSLHSLKVQYDLWDFFDNKITVPAVALDAVEIYLYRSRTDSLFNFDFIPKAFAGEPGEPIEETRKETVPYVFNLGALSLTALKFSMEDEYGGQNYQIKADNIRTFIKYFNTDNLHFHLSHLFTDSLDTYIVLSPPLKKENENSAASSVLPLLAADSLKLTNTAFRLENADSSINVESMARILAGDKIIADLRKMNVSVNRIQLSDHQTHVRTKSREIIEEKGSQTDDTSRPFTYVANSLLIERNEFSFDDNNKPKQGSNTVDFFHLLLKDFEIKADTAGYDGTRYFANIKQLSVAEKSGFRINRFTANASYSDSNFVLNRLLLETNKNRLQGHASLSYTAIGEITRRPGSTKVNAEIRDSRIILDELLYFQPGLAANKTFKPLLGKTFFINTSASGSLNRLHIPALLVQETQTRLLASADVYKLSDYKKLYVDLNLKEFEGTRASLLALLPANTIPDSLLHYIPEKFRISGEYRGTTNDFFADFKLFTSDGNATVRGTLKQITDKKKAEYDLSVSTDNLQLDKLLQDTIYGPASVSISVKGMGLELSSANAEYKASIRNLQYRKYNYHDIDATGRIASNKLKAHIQTSDPNLLMVSDTEYDMSKASGSFYTTTKISHIDLLRLGIAKDTLIVSGDIKAGIPDLDTAQLNGDFLISDLNVQAANRKFSIDSIQLKATHVSDTQTIELNSPFATAQMKGKYSIQALPAAIKTISNHYVYTTSKDTVYPGSVNAVLTANIHVPDSMLALVPGLKRISPFKFLGRINTDSSILAFSTIIPKLMYNDYIIDTLFASGRNTSNDLRYNNLDYIIGITELQGPSIVMEKSFTCGSIKQGVIKGVLELSDYKGDPRYYVPYKVTNDPIIPYLELMDTLVLDKKRWIVNEHNVIYLNSGLLKGSNLQINRQNESLIIQADSSSISGLPLQVRLRNFRLQNISEVFISDTAFIDGEANGLINIENFAPFAFTTNIEVDSLRVKEVNAGNLKIDINQQAPEIFRIAAALQGSHNSLTVKGEYNSEQEHGDVSVNLDSLNLKILEPFASRYLSKLGGNLHGQVTIKGSMIEPQVRGSIRTDSAELLYKAYGTIVKIPSAEIVFDEQGVLLDDFVITDSAGNKGLLDGRVYTNNYSDYKFDLKFTTDNFLAIGRKKTPDQTIYGPTHVNALVNIKGTLEIPFIDGSVAVKDKSEFTYINIPEEDKSARGEGIIEFFNPMQPYDSIEVGKKKVAIQTDFGAAVNMVINITPESKVTIVLDELSGDHLTINGSAALNFNMDASGRMSLTGSYQVEKGEYDLSISGLIRRKFSLERGSTITWSGDLMRANVDITAVYRTKTSAGELVSDIQTVPGIDKQKLEFEVWLSLKNRLLQPDIIFRLDMPENDRNAFDGIVYARIKQINSIPNDLNKQVMGLLVLNHFIADNPFASLSGGGSSFETQAYRTAGKLVTQELTNLVGDAIKGVNIDFALDVNEDYTTGKAVRNTDLKVGVSKQLFSNRLSVYVGSSFALESENQNANALTGLAGDVTAEYMLTRDGRFRLKAYRINQSEFLFEGATVKTGVTFVVVLEFYRFKNMFRGKRKDKRASTNE